MKKILVIPIFIFSCLSLTAKDGSEVISFEEVILEKCSVAVDCDGDGDPDYEGTVNCEFAPALEQQYKESCADPVEPGGQE